MSLIMSAVSKWGLERPSVMEDEEPLRLELLIMTVSCFPSVSDEFFKKTKKNMRMATSIAV